jgi:hypothetical protein
MALKPCQQQVLAKMRAGTPLYHDRKSGGCYLQHTKGMAVEMVDPFTVKQLLAGKYIQKAPTASGEASWLNCYRPTG